MNHPIVVPLRGRMAAYATLPAVVSAGSFRRRRLGRELRRLREVRSLTIEDVAPRADVSDATLSRLERAVVDIKINTVKALLDVYGVVDGEERVTLLALAREARKQGWWHVYGDVLPNWFEVYVDLEGEANQLAVYDSNVINGLCQTADYARALLIAARPNDPPEEISRRVELRIQRQNRLMNGDLHTRVIVDECVLHHPYGGDEVMSAQIRRLREMADLPNVSLQVLPADSPLSTCGAFTVMEFPADHPTVVYVENEVGALYIEKAAQIRQYAELYERLAASALSQDASLKKLEE